MPAMSNNSNLVQTPHKAHSALTCCHDGGVLVVRPGHNLMNTMSSSSTCLQLCLKLGLPALASKSLWSQVQHQSCCSILCCLVQCSFGAPDCGSHGTVTATCTCTCDNGWTTYAEQDLADYKYCTVATASTNGNSSTNCRSQLYPVILALCSQRLDASCCLPLLLPLLLRL